MRRTEQVGGETGDQGEGGAGEQGIVQFPEDPARQLRRNEVEQDENADADCRLQRVFGGGHIPLYPRNRIAPRGICLYVRSLPAVRRFWTHYSQDRRRNILPAAFTPRPRDWPDRGLHAAWIGHSTVLLKIDGVTIITDPVFSPRVGIGLGPVTLGLKRIVAPALDLRALPPIDIILLSHAHMDHFDLRSLRRLANRQTTVITAARTADLLCRRRYAAVRELGWGQKHARRTARRCGHSR